MNFFTEDAKFSENMAVKILNDCGIDCKLNNKEIVTDVDIITNEGKKIDVQLSANFARYGDFRLDIVSAFFPRRPETSRPYKYDNTENFLENFAHKFKCTIIKPGKIMQTGYLDFFLIQFYNRAFIRQNPDYIFIISFAALTGYMRERKEDLFNKIKINDKSRLADKWGSAFIPIKVNELRKSCPCFFGSPADLQACRDFIRAYIK